MSRRWRDYEEEGPLSYDWGSRTLFRLKRTRVAETLRYGGVPSSKRSKLFRKKQAKDNCKPSTLRILPLARVVCVTVLKARLVILLCMCHAELVSASFQMM